MLDEYRALSVAIRRPMGRWWRRVGLWWLLGLGVVMLAEGAIRGFLVPWLEVSSKAASTGSGGLNIAHFLSVAPWGWLGIADNLLNLARLLVYYACLLAGAHAARLAMELQREFPHPTPAATRRLCFLQALRAGYPVMLLWLVIGSSAMTFLLCTITGRNDTLLGNQPINAETYPATGMSEPWTALVSIVLLLALANASVEAQTSSWLWASALGCAPLLESAREVLFLLPVPRAVTRNLTFASLPQIETGLGWILGGGCAVALILLYRRRQRFWAGAVLALLLASAVLSGFNGTVPLVHHIRMKQGLDQIGASSPAGLALVFVRSLSDFPRSALVSYQVFGRHELSWITWEDAPAEGAAGALRFYVPKPWFVLAPKWTQFIVGPLNLLYLLLLAGSITIFLLGEAKTRPGPSAVNPPTPLG